jgi:hypothetical protein
MGNLERALLIAVFLNRLLCWLYTCLVEPM